MIENSVIYRRAVNLFDDPDINQAYVKDEIKFQKIMHPFLENGISIITAPTEVSDILSEIIPPEGKLEEFEGNGTSEYILSTIPLEGASVVFYINKTRDDNASYNKLTGIATFSRVVSTEETCAVEWYYAGAFIGDFIKASGKMPPNALIQRVVDLIARALVIAWADKEKNFLLDIRNLLTDTNFNLYSPANATKSKVDWVNNLRLESFNLQNKLAWELRNRNESRSRY